MDTEVNRIETSYAESKLVGFMLKVAVTGSAASGKSIVCNRLGELGFNVINTDRLAREVVTPNSPVFEAIVNHFGSEVLTSQGHLNRERLRKIIIKDAARRHKLEQLIHPEIIERMVSEIERLEKNGEPLVVVEIPLLFESGLEKHFDVVVMVSAEDKRKIQRIMARDHVPRHEAIALLSSQLPDTEKAKRADIVILNDGTIEHLTKKIDRVFEILNQKVSKTA
jgi:dephospho-CoA kinase